MPTKVEFPASDLPNNPNQNLIEAIDNALDGDKACVWWVQEPDGHYFTLIPDNEEVELQVLFVPSSKEGARSKVATLKGSKARVRLPT